MQNKKNFTKRIVDVGMTVLLLCLMAYQVTGEAAHEWIGMGMTVFVILHQILNRKWYGALLKGKYNPLRTVMTVVNILLIASFILTAFCGMSMSGYAVPFLYGMAPVSFVRRMHLSMSHWSFVLMGLHLGLHMRVILPKKESEKNIRMTITILLTILSGIGFWLFLRNNMPDYLFFKVPFALLDYEKAGLLVFVENLLTLLFFVFTGYQVSLLLVRNKNQSKAGQASGGKLYRIKPAQAYTKKDINYNNDNCRANREQRDASARPAVKGKVKNIRKYDVIFIGYPIWHGKEPKIIKTFLESYNLKGEKIVPFCTSGGSGISGSMKGIRESAKGAKVKKGKDLSDASYGSIKKWVRKKLK